MDEQQSFLISTDTTINPSVISSTNNNDSNSPQSPVNNESHTSFIDKEKSFEHELSGIPENEHLNRHIQDMMIDHVDTDDITEDTDDDEDDQGDINQQSGKMDPFNFHYSNNANDSDDSMKQVSDGNKDTGKLIYSKSASNNSPEDKRPRKFICRYCNKAFSLMNVLKVHERIHTGEKPYVCEICNKAFNQSGSLNRHKNTHTKRSSDNRSYSCRFCPRQFLHSSQLQDHETVEHSMEITLSKSKSNDTGAGSYITPPISSMADESNIIKQNHLSSQLLHNKVISNSLKLSGTEFNSNSNNIDKNMSNTHTNIDNDILDVSSLPYLNSTPSFFELNTITTGGSNKFPFPYDLNLISKFLPVATADELMRSIENNTNGSLNCSVTTMPTTNPTLSTATSTTTAAIVSDGAAPVIQGAVKQECLNDTNPFTCTLCSANLPSKTELDLHWGQHFIQQMEAQLCPVSANLLPSGTVSSPLPNPLTGLYINSNASSLGGFTSNLSFPFMNTNCSLKSSDPTERNKATPETSNTYTFDSRLPNATLENVSLLNSNNINSGAAAAAAAAASAAIVAALSQFLLVNTPGQSLPNPSLLAATAALTNPELLNTLMNTIPTSNNNGTSNNTQGSINEFNANYFAKLLNNMTGAHNSNFSRPVTHSNDLTQKLFDMDTTSVGLKEHALNFTVDKASNISPASLTKSPASSLSLTISSATTTTTPTQVNRVYPSSNYLNQKTSVLSNNSIWPCNLELDLTNRALVNPLQPNRSLSQLFTELDPNISMNTSSSTNSLDQHDKIMSTFNLSTCQGNLSSGLVSSVTENSFKSTNSRLLGIESENYSSDFEGGGCGGGYSAGGNLTDSTLSGSLNSSKRRRPSSPNNTPDSKARKCNFCNKQFNCTSALRIHYRKHSGERPYICKHCGKAFSQNGTLKRHSQTCKAAYSSINNNSVSNNKDFRFEQKFSISNDNNNILIMNSANHITDPMHLKPSNFPLLCAPIDELSDSEGQIKSPQTENTNPTIRNNTRLSSQYVCHEETEKQLNNMESSQIWMSTNSLKEEDEVSCLSNSLTSPIISNDKKRKCDSSRFYATVQRSDFSDQSINHFKQQQTENAGSTFNLKSQLSHWSDLDLSKLNNREIKQLLEKLHSIGKLYGCIDCQTFYLDEKMANFHLTKMHVKQLHSKTFQCFNCGTDLNNSLLFLKHFTHCLSSTKFNGMDLSIQSLTSVNSVSEITDSELIQNESENLKSLENHISEETINSCIDVPTEISDSTQKEITTTPINENNTSHSPFTGIKEQSEIQINGHNPEKKEADEETDRTSWSMGFPNSLDPRSTVKSVDSDTRE